MSHGRFTRVFPAPLCLRAIASGLALALICMLLTIGAIWAFPIWDLEQVRAYIREQENADGEGRF
jgi:hypothetical protein